ncbi:phosphotransferase [Solwaraspora sp. WMMD406]|uniref:phosphotransferase n=1 Tax=Solwaraspora sp. WMMD406 TaxID=3016095 RepID=UPI002416AEA7|nr:phosphotransferase [Solwaraspora sp. WMMD406]MDG4762508.1 phosphotransferase [Solwaraspora sp. WMMD406]MDG4768653.1 phosphotransferase [Solwaraspora sp. WMMD406]
MSSSASQIVFRPTDPDARSALRQHAARVGIMVEGLLHHTDKAIVAAGSRDGEPVVVKLLTTDDPYWTGRREHELDVYRRIAADPPPVVTPRLRYADERLTVLTRVPGARLADERHLTGDVNGRSVDVVLDTLHAVAAWMPHPPLPEPIADYHGRIDAEHAAGQLDDADRAALHQLVDASGDTRQVAHGDPLPANLLLADGRCAIIDFEHCGRYLPGYDLALLYTIGAPASPTLAQAITDRIHGHDLTVGFAVNLALLVAREIRLHAPLPDNAQKTHRLTALARLRGHAADLIRQTRR